MKKSKINLNILSVFYLLILFIQIVGIVVGLFYEYLYKPANANALVQLFIISKKFFNENWMGLSAFSIILLPLNNLYYSITNHQNNDFKKENSRDYLEYIFCIINILLYCEVYNVESLKEKVEFIKSNVLYFCITVIIIIGVILLSNFLAKYIVARNSRTNIIDEIVNREEGKANKKFSESDKKDEVKTAINNDLSQNQKEILKHPFSYAYENYKLYRARRKAVKYANRLEIKKLKENNLLQQAKEGEFYGDSSAVFIIISITILVIFAIAIYFIFKEGVGENGGIVSKVFESLNMLLKKLTNGLEVTEPNILNFFMVFGVIILGLICYILLVYTLTYIWKIWWYLAKKSDTKNTKVKKLVESLEKLFSDTIDEVVHLLMFIPDVLGNIIGIVYDGEQEKEDSEEEENNG